MIIRKPLPEISYFFSDWSGVWSDDRYPVYCAHKKLWKEYNIPEISFEEWKKDIPGTFAEEIKRCDIAEDFGVLFDKYANYFKEVANGGILPEIYTGALDTIKFLKSKNMKIIIISSHPNESLVTEIDRYGIGNYIDQKFGSIHNKKDGLLKISKNMNANPSYALYIGDTKQDVKSAKDANIHSVAICHGYHGREILENTDFDVLVEEIGRAHV